MRTFGVVVVLLAMLFVIASCSVQKSPSATTPPVVERPEPVTAAQVVALQIGDEYDEATGEVTNPTTTFAADTPAIHVRADMSGLTTDAMVHCILRAVEATDAEGNVIQDTNIASWQKPPTGEESTLYFEFTPEEEVWPVGTYEVEVWFKDELITSTELTVE